MAQGTLTNDELGSVGTVKAIDTIGSRYSILYPHVIEIAGSIIEKSGQGHNLLSN